jgi:hypothetical protein
MIADSQTKETDIRTNADILMGNHERIITAIKGGKGVTLTEMTITDDSATVERGSGDYTFDADEVSTWGFNTMTRLMTERKTFEPIGGFGPAAIGQAVLGQNLDIKSNAGNKNPFWVGLVNGDIRLARIEARQARTAARIEATGGFVADLGSIQGASTPDDMVVNLNSDGVKLLRRVQPSTKKARNAICRAVWPTQEAVIEGVKVKVEWYQHDKDLRTNWASQFVVSAATPQDQPAEAVAEGPKVEATAPSATATVSYKVLQAQAKAMGLQAGGSRDVLEERMKAHFKSLGL